MTTVEDTTTVEAKEIIATAWDTTLLPKPSIYQPKEVLNRALGTEVMTTAVNENEFMTTLFNASGDNTTEIMSTALNRDGDNTSDRPGERVRKRGG